MKGETSTGMNQKEKHELSKNWKRNTEDFHPSICIKLV
jgi:hypothetical protein